MREFTSPVTVDRPASGNLANDLLVNAEERPELVSISRRTADARATADGWTDVTAATFLDEVRALARGLVVAGIEPGDRIGVLCRTRYEWTLLDYALWYAGAVSVPVYETAPEDQVAWVLSDSGARGVVVEDARQAARLEALRPRLPGLKELWVLDHGDLDRLAARGTGLPDADLERRRTAVRADALATILYTAGTTGQPKGCELTHGNVMTAVDGVATELDEIMREGAATLLVLPLAHVFARVVQIAAVRYRVRLGHCPSVRGLREDAASFRPTFLFGVPRLFEWLFDDASQRATAEGRGRVFDRAAGIAIAYGRALDRGRVGPVLRAVHAVFERTVYRRLRDDLGGRCAYAVAGGAALGVRLAHFYRGLGIPLLESYGLSETCGAVLLNSPAAHAVGTVGRPLPGVTVRISEEGELLIRGDQVMRGYRNDPAGTAEALRDGWFRTGDLAEIDGEGFLRITGRRREILVTAGGKQVAPTALEERIRAHPLVAHSLVVGDGQPYVAALVTLDHDALAAWRRRQGKRGSVADLVRDPELVAEIQSAVDEANTSVSPAEAIRRFSVLSVEWTEENGHLTASHELKRAVVAREFRAEIAELFRT